jgi:hypothetical protein
MACKSFLDEPTHSRGLGKSCIAGKNYIYMVIKKYREKLIFFQITTINLGNFDVKA